jgi:lipoate-protein ligase A
MPYAVADGPRNMAADEALLESAVRGVASLRFYGWREATVSLGYFQPERLRRDDPRLAPLPYVRRPSGGGTLVHHHELTYALALPAGSPWHSGDSWLVRMHRVLAAALTDLGVTAGLHTPVGDEASEDFLCFRHFTPGDLLIGPGKVAGSAQRRQRGALMQHGSILLAQSPYTPTLPGIRELSGRSLSSDPVRRAVLWQLLEQTGWELTDAAWTEDEQRRLEELAESKYAQDRWNRKR